MDVQIRRLVRIPVDNLHLEGDLEIPEGAGSEILFAHGSGSSRHSPRNKFVARELFNNGFGTLLIDLLSEDEDVSRDARFDIDLLARRLETISNWLRRQPETQV